MFLALCHSLLTFNHEYDCILPVTAETQCKPADKIPLPKPPAYKEQDKAGSSLVPRIPSGFTHQAAKLSHAAC